MDDNTLPLRSLTFTYGYDSDGAPTVNAEWDGEPNMVLDVGLLAFVEDYVDQERDHLIQRVNTED